MTVVSEFELSPSALVLGETVERVPELQLELDRQYAIDPDRPISFVWIDATVADRFERAIVEDETVDDWERLWSDPTRVRYRIEQRDVGGVSLYATCVELRAELLSATVHRGRWIVQIRFPDRSAFTEFGSVLQDHGVTVRLQHLEERDEPRLGTPSPLTPEQREVLLLALDRGFFEVPRRTTMGGIAEELGISNQAVSERLRRAYAALVTEYVR